MPSNSSWRVNVGRDGGAWFTKAQWQPQDDSHDPNPPITLLDPPPPPTGATPHVLAGGLGGPRWIIGS